ncbi:MAG: hypothetical protein HRT94_03665 [Alphaproteobacteria bacterium]|nr:hypothetical protein [Alphaproteobacteria bacterium]
MQIQSSDKKLEKELTALRDVLVENGAWFHKNLNIVSEDHGMSVVVDGPASPGDKMMKVPESLLVQKHGMNISLKNSDFIFEPDDSVLSPVQIEIADRMIEIYNMTNKVNLHKEECSWILYKDHPHLLDPLVQGRTQNDYLNKKYKYLHSNSTPEEDETFTCESYLQTRVLGRQGKDGQKNQLIMPIIDYLNHDHRGSPFMFKDQKDDAIMHINVKRPFLERQECFVIYGVYDALDTFLNYGFPDSHAPYVRSIPMDIDINGKGKLKVRAISGGRNKQELPKQISDLSSLMPFPVKKPDGSLEISHLMIPIVNAPHALRRVLQVLIRSLVGKDETRKFVIESVYKAEEEILKANIEFYSNIIDTIDTMDGPDHLKSMTKQVATLQRNKLYKYTFNKDFFKIDIEEEPAIEAAAQ